MKYCLSVSDVYGTDSPKIPEGYKLTGEFRPPLKGEMFISLVSPNLADVCPNNDAPKDVVRLILEKLPPKPTIESIYGAKEPVIPEGYESTGELRDVRDGDIYLGATWAKGAAQTWSGPAITSSAYYRLILRKVKTYSDAEMLAHVLENIQSGDRYSSLGLWKGDSIKEMRDRIVRNMRADERE